MKNIYKILIVVAILIVITGYLTYYYIYNNLEWKLEGLGIATTHLAEEASGVINVVEGGKLKLTLLITNNSNLSFNLRNFKLKVRNMEGNEIGRIETIRKIHVPAKGQNTVDVYLANVNEMALLSDTLSGKLSSYKYSLCGLLGGFLPFRYSNYILS